VTTSNKLREHSNILFVRHRRSEAEVRGHSQFRLPDTALCWVYGSRRIFELEQSACASSTDTISHHDQSRRCFCTLL